MDATMDWYGYLADDGQIRAVRMSQARAKNGHFSKLVGDPANFRSLKDDGTFMRYISVKFEGDKSGHTYMQPVWSTLDPLWTRGGVHIYRVAQEDRRGLSLRRFGEKSSFIQDPFGEGFS